MVKPLMDEERFAVYGTRVLAQVPRLLSMLDREPESATFGSFDRAHWSWKFSDFPITMLQTAVSPLVLLWRHPFVNNPYYQNRALLQWILAAARNICRRQHRNGSFDSVGPFTQDHGVTLAMAYTLTEIDRAAGDAIPAELRQLMKDVVSRSCQFAQRSAEDYAFISNHQALFALAYLNASELLDEPQYRRQAEMIIDAICSRQATDGWYHEYEGPDPGYETLGLFYLAMYWQRTGSAKLLDSLRRSVAFFAHCVHPDGGVGGVYGSRHTSLFFPAGFEILANEIPLAAAVAQFMRQRLARQNVVILENVDAENVPVLAYSYVQACILPPEAVPAGPPAELPPLPWQSLNDVRHFPDGDIFFVGTDSYYAVINASKGGVCRVFDKKRQLLLYEDAGYLVEVNGRRWSSQIIGLGKSRQSGEVDTVTCTTTLAEVRQELVTPAKFLVLRLLNLTLFRSLFLGSLVRRMIIGRLIVNKQISPLQLQRTFIFAPGEIRISDRLHAPQPVPVTRVALPRSLTAIHMGSAKYFSMSDLAATRQIEVGGMATPLRQGQHATCEFTIRPDTMSDREGERKGAAIHLNQ